MNEAVYSEFFFSGSEEIPSISIYATHGREFSRIKRWLDTKQIPYTWDYYSAHRGYCQFRLKEPTAKLYETLKARPHNVRAD